jgi:hypothetical protein
LGLDPPHIQEKNFTRNYTEIIQQQSVAYKHYVVPVNHYLTLKIQAVAVSVLLTTYELRSSSRLDHDQQTGGQSTRPPLLWIPGHTKRNVDDSRALTAGCSRYHSYGMDVWGSNPGRQLFSLHNVQTSSGAHPAPYTGIVLLSSRVQWARHEADHSPPSITLDKNEWSCTSTSPYVCMV